MHKYHVGQVVVDGMGDRMRITGLFQKDEVYIAACVEKVWCSDKKKGLLYPMNDARKLANVKG